MFLKLKCHNTDIYPKEIVFNTDQIVYYYQLTQDTTMIHLSNGSGIEVCITEERLDNILIYKSEDPTPIKPIDDSKFFDHKNESKQQTEVEERLATSKQIAYVRSIAKKKGLDLQLPKTITFQFAKEFLDKYAPKKKSTDTFDWKQFDEDDGEFPGYR